jgi:hypothetical protein
MGFVNPIMAYCFVASCWLHTPAFTSTLFETRIPTHLQKHILLLPRAFQRCILLAVAFTAATFNICLTRCRCKAAAFACMAVSL